MPDQPTYPGVYVGDLPSAVRPIVGVSTSIALFIGRTLSGPLNEPTSCLSLGDFTRTFSDDGRWGDMARSVRLFFANGGTQCYVMRIGNANGASVLQTPPANPDPSPPQLADYTDSFAIIDSKVDLFNLMVLPADSDPAAAPLSTVWGPSSAFCQKRRALLLMDPPATWNTVSDATDPATGVDSLRAGLANQYAAIFYPRLIIDEAGLKVPVGPSGAMAGVIARIDSSRGVWKAPAGLEATIVGAVGVEQTVSDQENGITNQHGINTIRVFLDGIVNWGARTLAGDDDFGSEYTYIPVRRLANYIEESISRGTQWVVFEPNGEPLWAQIRLNVGSFMQHLFASGAFQGRSPREAYFVKCDAETTAPDDQNLGVVNIVVGFAPLRPAEFVIIRIQLRCQAA